MTYRVTLFFRYDTTVRCYDYVEKYDLAQNFTFLLDGEINLMGTHWILKENIHLLYTSAAWSYDCTWKLFLLGNDTKFCCCYLLSVISQLLPVFVSTILRTFRQR
jgi:hypothetical protein